VKFDGVRIARAGLLIGWIVVSMLAVAGFAAFSTDEDVTDDDASSTLASDIGRTAGAVSALAFVGTADTLPNVDVPSTIDLDPRAPSATGLLGSGAPLDEVSDRRGGVYVRSGYLLETDVRSLVSNHFAPEDVNRAIRVAWCMSSFNPAAINPVTGASGLFQHLPDDWAERAVAVGRPGSSIFDPDTNVAVAAWMLYDLPGGWSHWECAP
jgi:hypothetical protein